MKTEENTQHRKQVASQYIRDGLHDIQVKIFKRLEQKGYGTLASKHEILGIIEEEMYELKESIIRHGAKKQTLDELMDVAVGALFGYICIKNDLTDW